MLAILKLWLSSLFLFLVTMPAVAQEEEATWKSVAETAEAIVIREDVSLFALNHIRAQLLHWRDIFAVEQDASIGRLATLDAQILALGALSNDGEAVELALRRDQLERQRAEAYAPAALLAEDFARAGGLIRETDARISELETDALTARGATPLNPIYWWPALQSLGTSITAAHNETIARIRADWISGKLVRNAPIAVAFIAVAFWILSRGRNWAVRLRQTFLASPTRWGTVHVLLISLLKLGLPLVGLALLVLGLKRADILGASGATFLAGFAVAAAISIAAHWLAEEFFPPDSFEGPLNYDGKERAKFRRLTFLLGLGLAALTLISNLMSATDAPAISTGVLLFPITVMSGFVLYRFGKLLRSAPLSASASETAGKSRSVVGLICMAVAIASPLLIATGFAAASHALFVPWVLTIALLAFVMLLQQLVNVSWAIWRGQVEGDRGPLAPVLIGFGLFFLALPALALIWGADSTDMSEIWSRFLNGFTIGETTLSPSDFLTFVLLFVVGYLLTRFIQGSLRSNILPRTNIDLGGRNAVVAGVGYVGIILSAVVAITSAGIDLSNLALVAGALSVGIGFGLQTIVSNFVSGIILLVERPVSEGDWIEVNGQMGYVRNISVRSTRIETFDRTDVIIPNADLVSGQVTNWTRGNSVGRAIIPVGVAYGSDVDNVMAILKEIAMAHPMILYNPEPSVLFQNFGASSLDFEIRAILRDVNFMLSVKSEINIEIARQFEAAGIEIPFPQQDVWLRSDQGGVVQAGGNGT